MIEIPHIRVYGHIGVWNGKLVRYGYVLFSNAIHVSVILRNLPPRRGSCDTTDSCWCHLSAGEVPEARKNHPALTGHGHKPGTDSFGENRGPPLNSEHHNKHYGKCRSLSIATLTVTG